MQSLEVWPRPSFPFHQSFHEANALKLEQPAFPIIRFPHPYNSCPFHDRTKIRRNPLLRVATVFCRGAFSNYVDNILSIIDNLPTPTLVDICDGSPMLLYRWQFPYHLPTSFCQRSLWSPFCSGRGVLFTQLWTLNRGESSSLLWCVPAKASHFVHCKRNTRVMYSFSDKLTKVFIKLNDLKNKYYWGEFFLLLFVLACWFCNLILFRRQKLV